MTMFPKDKHGSDRIRNLIGILGICLCISMVAVAFDVNETKQQRRFLNNNLIVSTSDKGLISKVVQPFQIDDVGSAGTNIFIRFESGTNLVFIKKITVVGDLTTIEGTITNWVARTNATFAPIND